MSTSGARQFDANPAAEGAGDLGRRSEDHDPSGSPALDEVLEGRPRPEWEAFSLKLSYLDLTRDLDAPVDYIHRAIFDGEDLSPWRARDTHRVLGVSLSGTSIPQA